MLVEAGAFTRSVPFFSYFFDIHQACERSMRPVNDPLEARGVLDIRPPDRSQTIKRRPDWPVRLVPLGPDGSPRSPIGSPRVGGRTRPKVGGLREKTPRSPRCSFGSTCCNRPSVKAGQRADSR